MSCVAVCSCCTQVVASCNQINACHVWFTLKVNPVHLSSLPFTFSGNQPKTYRLHFHSGTDLIMCTQVTVRVAIVSSTVGGGSNCWRESPIPPVTSNGYVHTYVGLCVESQWCARLLFPLVSANEQGSPD